MNQELELVQIRLITERTLYSKSMLRSPKDVINFISEEFSTLDREVLGILNLNSQNQVINMNIVSVGSINNALVSPREVFKSSILSNAASIIIFHNHPSGNVNPSKDDIKITETLRAAGSILDIPVLDHIIIGGRNRDTYSFLEQGVLRKDMLRVKKSSKSVNALLGCHDLALSC